MVQLHNYVHTYLSSVLDDFLKSNKTENYAFLTTEEKVIIYGYTHDGYEDVNEKLRSYKGQYQNDYAELLTLVLNKIEAYKGLCYRGTNLTDSEIERYKQA